jgi:predicted nucleic acid-binding protein
MRVLFDTNIILDVLLNREPWVEEASALWQAHDEGRISGYVVASSLTDIFYIARRLTDVETAHTAVRLCLETFEICPVDRESLGRAESLAGDDFEDNLQMAYADLMGLDVIATRNKSDFEGSPVPALLPSGVLARLAP